MTNKNDNNTSIEANLGADAFGLDFATKSCQNTTPCDIKNENSPKEDLRFLTSTITKYAEQVQALHCEVDIRNEEILRKSNLCHELEQENIRIKKILDTFRKCLTIDENASNHAFSPKNRLVALPRHLFAADHQVAILGSGTSAISGDDGISITENESTSASGVDGISISENKSSSFSDDLGISISRTQGVSFSKKLGKSISGDHGTSTSEDEGISISGKKGTSEVGNGGIAIAGIGGACSAGECGVIASMFWDINLMQIRPLFAYVGMNGIKPNKYYTIESGVFVEIDDPVKDLTE